MGAQCERHKETPSRHQCFQLGETWPDVFLAVRGSGTARVSVSSVFLIKQLL